MPYINQKYSVATTLFKGGKTGVSGIVGALLALGLGRIGLPEETAQHYSTEIVSLGAIVVPTLVHMFENWRKNR